MKVGYLALGCVLLAGCAVTYPPLAAPAQEVPSGVELPPAGAGAGRLLVDANGEPARLTADGATVCANVPCAVSLPRGRHRLTLFAHENAARFDDLEVDLGERPLVVRHAIGVRRESPTLRGLAVVAFTLGATLVVAGASVASVGFLDSSPTWRTAGGSVAVTGLIGLGLGVSFALAGRPERWPGATRTWMLETR